MESLTKKTFTVSRSLDYTYYIAPPSKPNGITVLCIHGWPDDATEWSNLATTHLIPSGYGVLAIDCLGYGSTSKPTDPTLYHFQLMTTDIIEILDTENLPKVISLGHDWGSRLAQRLYNYHPTRVSGLAMINVAYVPASPQPFNLDAANKQSEVIFGYPNRYYWHLFGSKEGYKLLDSRLESLFTILHGEAFPGKESLWLHILCKPDPEGLEDYLKQDKRQPLLPYATESMRDTWIARMKCDGLQAPMCWYRATCEGIQDDEHEKISSNVVEIPALYVGFKGDVVCRSEGIQPAIKAGLLPRLTNTDLEGGHWGLHSNAQIFGETVVGWLKKEF